MTMNSFSFTTQSNAEWAQHIRSGLRKECELLTGISKDFPVYSIYITQNDQFVGGVLLEHFEEILWLDALWVHPNVRGQGLGKELLEKIMDLAREKKVREVQLNTYFESAHHFFSSCGFKDVACIPNWKYDRPCYLMKKLI